MTSTSSPSSRPPITVVSSALNELDQVDPWLESVAFADRCVVADHGSKDGTRERLIERGVEVINVEPGGIVEDARRAAAARVSEGWILVVDFDERVTLPLRDEICAAVASDDFAGYRIPFRHYVFGRWLRHGGWNDAHLRLFRADRGGYVAGRLHAQPEIEGEIGQLSERMVHFAHTSIHEFVIKMNRYTTQSAPALAAGEAGGLRRRPALPEKPGKWLRASASVFWNRYIKARGYRDGVAGFVIATLLSAYQFVEQAKAWEAKKGLG